MSTVLAEAVKVALELPAHQRLALAKFLLEGTDVEMESEVSAAWNTEIRERIRAIDEGRAVGVRARKLCARLTKS